MRDVFFCSVCLLGALVVAAGLLGDGSRRQAAHRETASPRDAASLATVEAVDAHFRAVWTSHGIEPAAQADDLLIARRLSLALTGSVPSLEEIRALQARDASQRLNWWVDHLLADRRSADYLAERFARAWVGTEDGPFLLFRRRRFVTWLADQMHENRPYDRLVRDLITARGLWTDQPQTNFITAALMQEEENRPDVNKLAARVSRAFLGVRLDCAQCHDHPFDERWQQSDFERLAAYFGRVRTTLTGIDDEPGAYYLEDPDTEQKRLVEPDVPFAEDLVDPSLHRPRRQLAAWITHQQNTAFARAAVNRVWALLFGRPLVEPVDDVLWDEGLPQPLTILADDFAAHGYNLRRLIRQIAACRVFQLESRARSDRAAHRITSDHERHWAVFPLVRLRPEQIIGSVLQASSLSTIDYQSHIVVRLARALGQQDFIRRYGDAGAMELDEQAGTTPQRLLMLNGEVVNERTKDNLVTNAATRIAVLAPDDDQAIEAAYLAVLTRLPTPEETTHFLNRLREPGNRNRKLGDIYWALINSAEFAWNH